MKSLAGLNERNHGKLEGAKVDGSNPVTEQEWRQRRRNPDDELDGGESLNQIYGCRAALATNLGATRLGAILMLVYLI